MRNIGSISALAAVVMLAASTYAGGFLAANGGTVWGARDALLAGLAAYQSYVNIHDMTHQRAEIRGQLGTHINVSLAPVTA